MIGTTYPAVRGFLERVRVRFGIRGFGDMTHAEIAGRTGLPVERAALAGEREFTEPFIMERPDDFGPFSDAAANEGLKVTRGGRFCHLMGIGQDKGKAVQMAVDAFVGAMKLAVDEFVTDPVGIPMMPAWVRVEAAIRNFSEKLNEAVEKDNS